MPYKNIAKANLILLLLTTNIVIYVQCAIVNVNDVQINSLQFQDAHTYKWSTEIQVGDGQMHKASYFVSFFKERSDCGYIQCYYGWVSNFTVQGGQTVEGYPQGSDPIKPIFQMKVNSKTDFVILRHPSLGDTFANIIEIACQLFEPMIQNVSQIKQANSSTVRNLQQSHKQFSFIHEDDFNRLNPADTFEISPSDLSNISQQLSSPTSSQKQTISSLAKSIKSKLKQNKNKGNNKNKNNKRNRISYHTKKLELKDIKADKNQLKQKIIVDDNFRIIQRAQVIEINIPSDSIIEGQEYKSNLISYIKVLFDKIGSQSVDGTVFKNYVKSLTKQKSDQCKFTKSQIQTRRKNPQKYFNPTIPSQPNPPTLNQTNPILIATSPNLNLNTPIQNSRLLAAQADTRVDNNIITKFTVCGYNLIPKPRLLLEDSIFKYEKQVYTKTILGKQFSISLRIENVMIDQKIVKFRGLIVYDVFGVKKNVQAFGYSKDISYNWSKGIKLSGSWNINFYIPLPPPVSALGINFGFSVSYSISGQFFAKGNPNIVSCVYNFALGASASTGVGVDATATVRAVAIQGGVFIGGNLVKLSTDPQIKLAINLKTKRVTKSVEWYYNLNAFEFKWGFFWRSWSLLKGWSQKKTIKDYKVTNGVTSKVLVYKG